MAMNISLPSYETKGYTSLSQIARIRTEAWAQDNLYCLACSSKLSPCAPNTKAKDFDCFTCEEEFQLKSSSRSFGAKVIGAEYNTTIASVRSGRHPSLILLVYNTAENLVSSVQFVHRSCITTSCIIPRKPLALTARRAGWQGCMFNLELIPNSARVDLLKQGRLMPRKLAKRKWAVVNRMLQVKPENRGWTADLLNVIEKLSLEFHLNDVYAFETKLGRLHPGNSHIRAKIRQQLQILRDSGVVNFLGIGKYSRVCQ